MLLQSGLGLAVAAYLAVAVASCLGRYSWVADLTTQLDKQRADTAIYKHTDGYYYMTASVPDYKRVELRRATTLVPVVAAEP